MEKFYWNLELYQIKDNTTFWQTTKPLLSDDCIYSSSITLANNMESWKWWEYGNILNYEILGKQYFPKNLKLADITPVYKEKVPTLAENYRPVSVLTSVLSL